MATTTTGRKVSWPTPVRKIRHCGHQGRELANGHTRREVCGACVPRTAYRVSDFAFREGPIALLAAEAGK